MRYITRTLVAALVVLALSGGAQAQGMDMSWAIASQMQNQAMGDYFAAAAAQAWLQEVTAYRMATGYTGPIQAPVSHQSLQSSIQGANAAFDDYLNGLSASSARTDAALANYSNHAILNQGGYVDPSTGWTYTLPDSSPYYYANPSGSVVGTEVYGPPTYQDDWTPLVPVW